MNIINPETGSKKMNKNILIVLGGAVLAAVLVAMLVQLTLGGDQKKEVVPVEETMVDVLVASKDLRVGHELSEGDLRWQGWPEDTLFKGAIIRDGDEPADEVLEGRLERTFYEGEAVVRSGILKETKNNIVAARLKPGERAMAIEVDAENMVAGFVSPGNYVDVILTYRQKINVSDEEPSAIQDMVTLNLDSIATETILQNVRVLAVDQQAEVDDEESVKVGKTVTLAVPIRDAEKLALASEMGVLTLAMRGVGDDKENDPAPAVSDARLTSIDDEIHAEYLRMKKEGGGGLTGAVKIYNGAQVSTVPVR